MHKKLLGIIIGLAILLSFSACLEDLFNSTEDEADTTEDSFVGKWCLVTQIEDGIKSTVGTIITMNDDGTGNFLSGEANDSFTWDTEGGTLNIITGDNENFSATYQFADSTVTLSYTEEGHNYVELYAKYTGERNSELIGKWVSVRMTADGVDEVPAAIAIFGADGSAVSYFIEQTDIEAQVFSWSTSDNYLLNDFVEADSYTWTGVEYTLSAPLLADKEYYNGVEYITTFIKDSGEKDPALTGTWNLTGLAINNAPIPSYLVPQGWALTLNAGDGTGSFVLDATTATYFWTTNSGYILIYPTTALMPIGIGQQYNIESNTLTFSIAFNARTVAYYFGSNEYLANLAASTGYVKADFTFAKQ